MIRVQLRPPHLRTQLPEYCVGPAPRGSPMGSRSINNTDLKSFFPPSVDRMAPAVVFEFVSLHSKGRRSFVWSDDRTTKNTFASEGPELGTIGSLNVERSV